MVIPQTLWINSKWEVQDLLLLYDPDESMEPNFIFLDLKLIVR
jgi:hypothetical protein